MEAVTVTRKDYRIAIREEYGWCIRCKEFFTGSIDPNWRKQTCESCWSRNAVWGPKAALEDGLIEIQD